MGKHLDFYMQCMNNNETMPYIFVIGHWGRLCSIKDAGLIDEEIFKLFSANQLKYQYWADDNIYNHAYACINRFKFTKLRQTIVLLMAAINNEL